jgi:hypothetical protein
MREWQSQSHVRQVVPAVPHNDRTEVSTAPFTNHDYVFFRDNSFQNCPLLDSNPSPVRLQ